MTGRVVLVVADHADLGVRAAARAVALSPRGTGGSPARVVVVPGDDLAAARWSHRIGTDGRTTTTISLPGRQGGTLSDDDIAAVLFRSQGWQVPVGLRGAPAGDVAYARAELTALFVSWLASLGPKVVNSLEGGSPWGPAWAPARWRQVAALAGLPVGEGSTDRSVLVAGEQISGPRSAAEARLCRELAASVGCRLLEVSFTSADAVCDVAAVPVLAEQRHVVAAAALLAEVAA